MRKLIFAALVAMVSACTQDQAITAGQVQIATCDTFNSALLAINSLDDKGMLGTNDKANIRQAVALASPICSGKAKLATDVSGAAQDLASAISTINAVLKEHE